MSTQLAIKYGFETSVPVDDFVTVKDATYVARNVNVDALGLKSWDVLKPGPLELRVNPSMRRHYRDVLSVGGFTIVICNMNDLALMDEQGGAERRISVPFFHPTEGLSWSLKTANFITVGDPSNIRELVISALPCLMDPTLSFRVLKLAYAAGRDVTASVGRALPIMITRGPIASAVTGAPDHDMNTLSPSEFF
jgi:hypothetical protein